MIRQFLPTPKVAVFALLLPNCCLLRSQTSCFITINQSQVINPNAGKLLGNSFDGRTGAYFISGQSTLPLGYYDPTTGALLPGVAPAWNRMPLNGVRYPGNLAINNWNWSYTIGSLEDRLAQPIGPGLPSQSLAFGFDEFMAMTASKGLPSQEVQIMVNITASTGQPDPAVLAADWVEYANLPNDGANPRGGRDWAKARDSLGHPTPYNVTIWNIGNEPWGPSECCQNDPALYISIANPVIDSMRNLDPSLLLTLPAVGNGNSTWNQAMMTSPLLAGKFYGLSPHAFYDEDPNTSNPSVAQVETSLKSLAATADALGLKIIVGDHAHYAPPADPDKAMRWQGALATADFLLMVSQISNIELANFWIYGNPRAVWHPIRANADGTYTLMAAPQLYERLDAVFIDQSLPTTVADSAGGTVPLVRAAAFKSNDGARLNVAVVNTDYVTDRKAALPVLPGYFLLGAKLTSADISADTSQTTVVAPLPDGKYALPHASILFFEFSDSPLAVEFAEPIRAYPVENGVRVEWATASEANSSHFEVERSRSDIDFEKIGQITAQGNSTQFRLYGLTDAHPFSGQNYYRIKQVDVDGRYEYSKIVSSYFEVFDATIYPNPASDLLFVELPPGFRAAETGLIIFDALGKEVYKATLTISDLNEIKIAGWTPGVYCLKFEADARLPSQVFIKK